MSFSINNICDTAVNMGVAGIIGFGVSAAFSIVNPIHGAVFCATSVLVSKIIDPIFKEIFQGQNANRASKIVGNTVSLLVGIAISAGISTLIGFPITFTAGIILTAACILSVALAFFVATAYIGCLLYTRNNFLAL